MSYSKGVYGVVLFAATVGAAHAVTHDHDGHVLYTYGMVTAGTSTDVSSHVNVSTAGWARSLDLDAYVDQSRDDNLRMALNYPDGQRKLGTIPQAFADAYRPESFTVRRST